MFAGLGVPWAADAMNLIVITAALSSCNSGLYATGRIVRSMGLKGEAPGFTAALSWRRIPIGGVLFTASMFLAGIALFSFVPERAFNIATACASLGVVTTWGTLVYCQLRLRRTGHRSAFPMPGTPYTNWLTLAFLALVVFLMPFADQDQRVAFYLLPVVAAGIAAGWFLLRLRRKRLAAAADPASPAVSPAE
ncbi:amino acid permease [Nonomuraea ferruginea]